MPSNKLLYDCLINTHHKLSKKPLNLFIIYDKNCIFIKNNICYKVSKK